MLTKYLSRTLLRILITASLECPNAEFKIVFCHSVLKNERELRTQVTEQQTTTMDRHLILVNDWLGCSVGFLSSIGIISTFDSTGKSGPCDFSLSSCSYSCNERISLLHWCRSARFFLSERLKSLFRMIDLLKTFSFYL